MGKNTQKREGLIQRNRRKFCRALVGASGALLLGCAMPVLADEPAIPPHLKDYAELYKSDPRKASLQWFQDAKFGMMICYGLYSLDGIHPFEQHRLKIPVREYEKKMERFTAEKFDAEALCDLAVAANMKYVTLVLKHCEGFCLWDSKQTDFNSMRSAAKRDLVRELVDACNKRGLGFFAFYEYGFEWRHPHGPRVKDFTKPLIEVPYDTPDPTYAYGKDYDLNKYIDYAHAQIEELLTNYGPIAGVWIDGLAGPLSGDASRFRVPELYEKIRRLQPHALISFKFGLTGTEDFNAPEREQLELIKPGDTKPIELCETLVPGWGYAKGAQHKDADWVWQSLSFCGEMGYNYLLNVAPAGDGSVLPQDVATLREVGRRLRAQGWPKGVKKLTTPGGTEEAY